MTPSSNKTEESPEMKPEAEKIREEIVKEWFPEEKEVLERKELTLEEKEKKEKLREEIEKAKLPSEKEVEAFKEAEEIKKQSVQGKIKNLLDLAQSKGLSYAVKVAKETKDPLLIDLFHDILVKEGLFEKFPK